MWRDNIRAIYWIALKDIRTYYFKPPAISWGIVFPAMWVLAFYLRMPSDFQELAPGLIAMTILFSTTAAEAVVINFELRLGSLERLLLAPVDVWAVLLGKVIGGAFFGIIMAAVVSTVSIFILGVCPNILYLALIIVVSSLLFSALGAFLCTLVREVFEAQTLLNLPRFVMIFLCGVVYPVSRMPVWLQYISSVLPLTYTVNGLRNSFSATSTAVILRDVFVLIFFFLLFIFPAVNRLRHKFE